MAVFQDLFEESRGQPIKYNGRMIQMQDIIFVGSSASVCLVFESVNSEWQQGIALRTKGYFIFDGEKIDKPINLWRHSAPELVKFDVFSTNGELRVYNIWDGGDGVVHAWHNGAAMIVEGDETSRRYMCNDGHPDDDFNDLIFRLEVKRTSEDA